MSSEAATHQQQCGVSHREQHRVSHPPGTAWGVSHGASHREWHGFPTHWEQHGVSRPPGAARVPHSAGQSRQLPRNFSCESSAPSRLHSARGPGSQRRTVRGRAGSSGGKAFNTASRGAGGTRATLAGWTGTPCPHRVLASRAQPVRPAHLTGKSMLLPWARTSPRHHAPQAGASPPVPARADVSPGCGSSEEACGDR